MSRRWVQVGAVLAAAALLAAGCGRDDDDEATGADSSAAPGSVAAGAAEGSVQVWAMGTEGEQLDVLATEFEAANPDVDVQVTPVPWASAHDKIATAIAGGQTPDVTMVGTTWMGEFAKSGALDTTPSDLVDQAAFFQGAWDTTVVDGTSYGVPWYVETRLIYYRKDLAEQAGLQPPTTWDELKAFVTALQQQGVDWGIDLHTGGAGAWQTFMPFAWQAGAEIETDGEFTLDSEPVVKALEYYQSYFTEGLADPDSDPTDPLEVKFVDGKIGSFISGPWHMNLLREQGGAEFEGKWDVAVMPKDRSGTSFVGGSNLTVFKDAANRDAAWKFVSFLMQPDVQQTWYETVTDLPSVQSAWDSGELAEDPMLAKFGTQLEDAKAPPAIPTWEQVAAVMDTEIEALVKSGTSPADAAAAIQSGAAAIGTGE